MSSLNQFRLLPRDPRKKTSSSAGTSEHKNLGTGKPTHPVSNPCKKYKKPPETTTIKNQKNDDIDIIDRKHNAFAASISNDPKFYGYNYNFIPPACSAKPQADSANIATPSTNLPFNAPKKPSFFNNMLNACPYTSNIDSTKTPAKNDMNLNKCFD